MSPTNGTLTTYRYQVRATNAAGTFGAYNQGTAFSVPRRTTPEVSASLVAGAV